MNNIIQSAPVYRYLPLKYCEQWLEGQIRLSSSSKFNDGSGSLTFMQMDDEDQKSANFHASSVGRLKPLPGCSIPMRCLLSTHGSDEAGVLYRLTAHTEWPYWMCCFSTALDLRLFGHFAGDPQDGPMAVVIVRDPSRMMKAMEQGYRRFLDDQRGSQVLSQPVFYHPDTVDVIRYGRGHVTISPFFSKPKQYEAQAEYRWVAYPASNVDRHLDIEVHPPKYCDIITQEELERNPSKQTSVLNDQQRDVENLIIRSRNAIQIPLEGRSVRHVEKRPDGSYGPSKDRCYSNNAASVLLDYLTDNPHGPKLSAEDIDWESFYKAERLADRKVGHIDKWGRFHKSVE